MSYLKILIALVLLSLSVSCGAIIKPQDVGKERTEQLDWNIALLDASGLVFFLVPAVAPNALGFISATLGGFISIASITFDYINGTLFIKKAQFD